MGKFLSVLVASFVGRILAAIFVALCFAFGFGPDKWANFMIEAFPHWLTPNIARNIFILLGVLTGLFLIASFAVGRNRQTKQGKQLKDTSISDDLVELPPRISLVELLKEAERQGWRFTAYDSQHIFDFTHVLRDAGSTEIIQFWGRKEQRIGGRIEETPLTRIGSGYWETCWIRGLSCLKILDGMAANILADNFQTITESPDRRNYLYNDIQLDRKQALSWLHQQTPSEISDSNYDKPVLEALYYIATGNWQEQTIEEGMLKALHDAAKDLRQKARDGGIVIYGRDTNYSPSVFDPIPAEFWRSHQIKLMDVLDPTKTNNDIGTEITLIGGKSHVGYKDMHTSRHAIERLCVNLHARSTHICI